MQKVEGGIGLIYLESIVELGFLVDVDDRPMNNQSRSVRYKGDGTKGWCEKGGG